jgi:tetratricopeptide (TPR) repeat protein
VRHFTGLLVLVVACIIAFSPFPAAAQAGHIEIAAGTPEDHDLQAITAEQDSGKKISMYEDFVQKYSSNPAAVAYGNWQLSQAYQAAGDLQKALDAGDKAVAAAPQNLDILVSQGSVAQQNEEQRQIDGLRGQGRSGLRVRGQRSEAGRDERRRFRAAGERRKKREPEQL